MKILEQIENKINEEESKNAFIMWLKENKGKKATVNVFDGGISIAEETGKIILPPGGAKFGNFSISGKSGSIKFPFAAWSVSHAPRGSFSTWELRPASIRLIYVIK